jgi:hypothetical protein
MVGLHKLAKGWNVQTLICDATGDAELLRAIWPQLETDESVQGWQQLPKPKAVRVFQCVNRTISKLMVAVEGKNEKALALKIEGARRLYAALLMKAMEYGGADVGVIVYRSTREWIEQNCCVPEWMKLMHRLCRATPIRKAFGRRGCVSSAPEACRAPDKVRRAQASGRREPRGRPWDSAYLSRWPATTFTERRNSS